MIESKQGIHNAQYATYNVCLIKNAAVSVKNEVLEMIAKVRSAKAGWSCRLSAEIQSLQAECDSICREKSKTATELAYAGVISYNRKNLERELQNESQQQYRHKERRTKTQPNQNKKQKDVEL